MIRRLAVASGVAAVAFAAALFPSVPRRLAAVVAAMDPAVSQDDFDAWELELVRGEAL